MGHWTVSFLVLGIFAVSVQAQTPANFTNTLMPQPEHLSVEAGELQLTPAFTAVTDRFRDARLDEAIGRTLVRLQFQTGLQIATAPARGSAGTLTITVDGPGETVQSLDEDESYSLQVTGNTLGGMAAVKLNVFHWHLTDDQGFRIESKIFPKLTGMGSDGLFYTQEEAREIVIYARARG